MTARIRTTRLELISKSRADVQAMIDGMTPHERAQISNDWMARFLATNEPDPWVFGFKAVLRDDATAVGTGGFAAPPADGVVEIAYGVNEAFRDKGYATEIARGLVAFVFAASSVERVRAHTLPDGMASQKILLKCGFQKVDEIDDPADGLVYRFEKSRHGSKNPGDDVTVVSLG